MYPPVYQVRPSWKPEGISNTAFIKKTTTTHFYAPLSLILSLENDTKQSKLLRILSCIANTYHFLRVPLRNMLLLLFSPFPSLFCQSFIEISATVCLYSSCPH